MACVLPAKAIDEVEQLADAAHSPKVEWINLVTGKPLRRQSVEMIRRTAARLDVVNDSVRYLHMCAGLLLNFETESHQEQFVSQLQTRPVTWLQAA
jgi:molybdenum cofactor biosynthesis enzyme MoaA